MAIRMHCVLKLIVIWIVSLGYTTCSNGIKSSQINLRHGKHIIAVPSQVLTAPYVLQCARNCHNRKTCTSFNFNEESKSCELIDENISHPLEVVDENSWVFGTTESHCSTEGDIYVCNCKESNPITQDCTVHGLGFSEGGTKTHNEFAASFYNPEREPSKARLGNDLGWVAFDDGSVPWNSWLQLDLGSDITVHRIDTQGCSGCSVKKWVTSFVLKYTLDQVVWCSYKENKTVQVFTGNSNSTGVKTNVMSHPFVARVLRLYPISLYDTEGGTAKIGLRVEVYGC
ncbi:unnamed protein product [Owenia fusiformis]|uniref:Uncharacterized protein n=1 Tax=Owenia fusiformis TaxID=6347 RepID=A0A8J1U8M1_OWEFU|nr:unnamed protein product [Owenia fusiformis]